jgi:hypothetical protein
MLFVFFRKIKDCLLNMRYAKWQAILTGKRTSKIITPRNLIQIQMPTLLTSKTPSVTFYAKKSARKKRGKKGAREFFDKTPWHLFTGGHFFTGIFYL